LPTRRRRPSFAICHTPYARCGGDLDRHRRLTIARDCGERIIEGHALYGIGLAFWMMERHGAAADHYRQALAVAHAIADLVLESGSLNGLGETARSTVFPTCALRKHSEALIVAEQIGDPLELPRARPSVVLTVW
jgi:hypothetical protein